MKAVIVVEKSSNTKTGIVSATYAPIFTCPTDCPFRDHGCYAQSGPSALHLARINKAAAGKSIVELAEAEAIGLASLTGHRALRLHVVGDCSTDDAARIVSCACDDYMARHDQAVWSYTHAWRTVSVDSWGGVSILASCETALDVYEAFNRGYTPSVTGNVVEAAGFRSVICPAQVRDVNCVRCRLCWNGASLRKSKKVVTFLPHGARKRAAEEAIMVRREEVDE